MEEKEMIELLDRKLDGVTIFDSVEVRTLRSLIKQEPEISANAKRINDLHKAFLEPPVGSDKSFVEDLRDSVNFHKQASVISKIIIWTVPFIAGFLAAGSDIIDWVKNLTGGPNV